MKLRLITLVMIMTSSGCMSNNTVATSPSPLELETSNNIDQFINKIEKSYDVDKVNNGNVVYVQLRNHSNVAKEMQGSLRTLCEDRYKAAINPSQDVNLHEYGGSQLQLEQATDAARQWIIRKNTEIDVSATDAINGQCISYHGEAQTLEILYAYQLLPASDTEANPAHLIVMKNEYFVSMVEEALANEPETYEQRKIRLAEEAVLAKELEQIEIAKQAKIAKMAPFVGARGKQVCKKFTTSDKLLKYEIKRDATIVGFLEDNTSTRIQIRISGLSIDNKKPQDLLVSDDIDYKGSKVITGNIIWDSPSGWYFCDK